MNLSALIAALESLSLVAIAVIVGGKLFDALCARLVNRRVFDKLWQKGMKKGKAYLTRYKKIKADFEFTAYTQSDLTIAEAEDRSEIAIEKCANISKNNVEIRRTEEINNSSHQIEAKVQYLDHDPFVVTFDLVPDSTTMVDDDVQRTDDANLSSIGISIRFEFAFNELKGVLMDLNNFADFLRQGIDEEFKVQNYTNSRLTVGSLKNDLTLDDWIEERHFEVSLLLKADQEERSVEFYGDKAIITSPYEQVDDKTADYIRATLLNYYL